MKTAKDPLGLAARVGMSVALGLASLFAAFWSGVTVLHAFNPFNYVRFVSAIWIAVTVSITTFLICQYSSWNRRIVLADRSTFIKILAWVSIILALDSLVIEPYALRYFFPRFGLDGFFRWQCQLIVAGLFALTVAISKRSWRWVPFSLLIGAFGVLWTLGILFAN